MVNYMGKSVECYLAKGLDIKMAEYFASGRKKITDVVPNDNFTLTLSFNNGEKRIFDVAPLLKEGTVFETFLNLDDFKRVYIDDTNCVAWDINPEVDSEVVWNNKVDLCPDCCYVDSIPVDSI